MSLTERLRAGEFEHGLSLMQTLYYSFERTLGAATMSRRPPGRAGPRLLNLGCGQRVFPDWINADDYALKRWLRDKAFRPDWFLDITRPWRCDDDYWDGIFTEHVIEHVTYAQAVHVFAEARRTLKPGAWLRVSVPGLRRFIAYYNGDPAEAGVGDFPHPAIALSHLTQMHFHRSVWDESLMILLLAEAGFVNATATGFGTGHDPRLVRDEPSKRQESQYVEAQKPF